MAINGKANLAPPSLRSSLVPRFDARSKAGALRAEYSPLPLRVRPVARLSRLYVGLAAYATSMVLMVEARLGNQPWDVFHQGVARRTGLSLGLVTIIVGAIVLLLWWPLRQRPGLGTLSNVVFIGVFFDVADTLIPTPSLMWERIGFLIGGVLLCAVASGLYIGARLGPGPRDGLMTGLAARGHSIRLARTLIEVSVVVVGFLLGGTLGIGTVLYAVAIGPLVQLTLPLFAIRTPQAVPSPAGSAVSPADPPVRSVPAGVEPEPATQG